MSRTQQFDRRVFLRRIGTGLAATGLASIPEKETLAAEHALSPQQFKDKIRGPILSIPTPFTEKLDVDYEGVRRMIKRALPYGIRIFSLTAGNSQYPSLKYEEIVELTRVMVDAAGQQGVTIAATDDWDVDKTIEYAQVAEAVGADALQVLRSKTDDEKNVVDFFQETARRTKLPIVLHGNFAHTLLEKLMVIDSIVAMKEDVGLEYYIQTQRKFGNRLAIFEGGPEYGFLVAHPYGSSASYTTLGTFAPQITQKFWQAVDQGDLKTAYQLVIKYEHPLFDRWSQEFWRASLEHFGVACRYMRPPYKSFSDEQMRDVARFYDGLGLSPDAQ